MNKYQREFIKTPKAWKRNGPIIPGLQDQMSDDYRSFRTSITSKFSYAIPTDETINSISKGAKKIFDYGCASAYWGYLLKEAGSQVRAFDIKEQDKSWMDVEIDIEPEPDEALLLVWPPDKSTMAMEAITKYPARQVIYVGELLRGCAEGNFFNILLQCYDLVEHYRIPQWFNRSDAVYIFERYPEDWDSKYPFASITGETL